MKDLSEIATRPPPASSIDKESVPPDVRQRTTTGGCACRTALAVGGRRLEPIEGVGDEGLEMVTVSGDDVGGQVGSDDEVGQPLDSPALGEDCVRRHALGAQAATEQGEGCRRGRRRLVQCADCWLI